MVPGTSRSKKDKRQSMANAKACAAEDRHSKRAKGSTSYPSPSRVLRVCLDLCIVFAAATNDVSGEQPMGDHPANAAAPPPGEVSAPTVDNSTKCSVLLKRLEISPLNLYKLEEMVPVTRWRSTRRT